MRTTWWLLILGLVACGGGTPTVTPMQPPTCGASACGAGQRCEAGQCHVDCGAKVRCGEAEACCADGELCYLGACTAPGAACIGSNLAVGACGAAECPPGNTCEPAIGHCMPQAKTGASCEYHPQAGAFSPKVKWAWTGSSTLPDHVQVVMTPVVADLDGDCLPDIVFASYPDLDASDGVVRAVRGDGSGELWTVSDPTLRVRGAGQIALGDVDRDGRVEIFVCLTTGELLSLGFDGKKKWVSSVKVCTGKTGFAPSLADVDHDGHPEVIVGFTQLDALTGTVTHAGPGATFDAEYSVAVELDGDETNGMEIVGGSSAYHADGSLYWNLAGQHFGFPAIGDLDGDGAPDVVLVDKNAHTVGAYKHDGTRLWGPVDVNNGVPTPSGPTGGGPPTIADFDGDGQPDVAAAAGYGYLVLRGSDGTVLWQSTETVDITSRVTGSSVFDFEGDGRAEVVYNDEHNLRVYDGATGDVRLKICSTSTTAYEYPVVVDVDGDNHAEIVVVSNNARFATCDADVGGGTSPAGFRVIGDAGNRWVTTRRVWNQHTYHVTNVDDDGTIPQHEAKSWAQPGLNAFRQNKQPDRLFAAPDLAPVGLRATYAKCNTTVTLVVSVANQGSAGVGAGVPVTFYRTDDGLPTSIATVYTQHGILPGGSEEVSYDWSENLGQDGAMIYVTVDEASAASGPTRGTVNECDEQNNTSQTILRVGCPIVL